MKSVLAAVVVQGGNDAALPGKAGPFEEEPPEEAEVADRETMERAMVGKAAPCPRRAELRERRHLRGGDDRGIGREDRSAAGHPIHGGDLGRPIRRDGPDIDALGRRAEAEATAAAVYDAPLATKLRLIASMMIVADCVCALLRADPEGRLLSAASRVSSTTVSMAPSACALVMTPFSTSS
jgi:hypothetical protein